MNHNQVKTIFFENITFILVTILGISFWFFLTFPWENHNESYYWLYVFKISSLWDILTKNVVEAPTFRPLKDLLAYAGYKLTGGNIYIHQLFNYFVAILAWSLALLSIKEKKLFSVTFMFIGGFLFSGYIYLFHLHGLNYSPILFLISAFIYLFDYKQRYDDKTIMFAFFLTIIGYLFHPAALLIFISYYSGIIFEKFSYFSKKQLILSATILLLAVAAVIVILIIPDTRKSSGTVITSYKMLEVHKLISIFLIFLTIATIASIDKLSKFQKIAISILSIIVSIWFLNLQFPLIIIWIFFSFLKMIIIRKWSIAFLIMLMAYLPLGLRGGSPTYTIFVTMACTFALPIGWKALEKKLKFVNKKAMLLLYAVGIVLIIFLRNDINIPLLDHLTKPIFAEKEKTFQLKTMINWVLNSNYRDYQIVLHHEKYEPGIDPDAALNRANMPPTSQYYLDMYMEMMRGPISEKKVPPQNLVITFGNEVIEQMHLLKYFEGKYAGKAMIFLACTELK